MNEAARERPRVSLVDRVVQALVAAAAGALIAALAWLAGQAFDWNQWRGKVDLQITHNRTRIEAQEVRFNRALDKIEAALRRIEKKIDGKVDKQWKAPQP